MADVILTLFGPPSAQLAAGPGRSLALPAKSLALLAVLALVPGPHSREELADLLWGDHPDTAARTSLRQALAHLRENLGEALEISRGSVALREVRCDALDFIQATDHEPRTAAQYDVPRFLAGFGIRHAPAFDEWAAAMRRDLLRRYEQVLAALAREAMGQWRWREAAAWAERWLAAEPYSDEAARLAVEALYLAGDRNRALARAADVRRQLAAEADAEPSRALAQLVQRIESDNSAQVARPISDEWYARAPTFEASLIGRDAEWQALRGAWKDVRRGDSRIVLLEGEPGVGKTRLADEFLRWTVANGGIALRGHAYDARAGVPYGPLIEVLRGGLAAPGLAGTDPQWLSELSRLVPELRERFPHLAEPRPPADPADGWRLFEAAAQAILALVAERPVLVVLDDLHWSDGDSCNLLHFLVRRLAREPVLWVATVTLGELEHDAPAARLARVLRAKSQAAVVPLGALSEEDVGQMLREMGRLSNPASCRRFAARIHQVTRGNPFYIVELLKTLFAQGLLEVKEETREWTTPASSEGAQQLPLPPTVHDAIAERVERLPPQLRELLITVALAGSGCTTETLSHAHGISRLHAAALCDALLERRLVLDEDGVYRCAHPMIARVVRDALTYSRRREVHRVIGLALALGAEQSGEGDEIAGDIARHARLGGERALAHRWAVRASTAALQRYAFEEALTWLDLAAGTAGGGAETDAVNRLTADVLELAGWREVPASVSRSDPAVRELEREDLDLEVPATFRA